MKNFDQEFSLGLKWQLEWQLSCSKKAGSPPRVSPPCWQMKSSLEYIRRYVATSDHPWSVEMLGCEYTLRELCIQLYKPSSKQHTSDIIPGCCEQSYSYKCEVKITISNLLNWIFCSLIMSCLGYKRWFAKLEQCEKNVFEY